MPWLVLGIAVVIGLILIGRGLFGLDPRRTIKIVLWVVLMAMALGGISVLARGGARVVGRTRSGPWVILAYFTSDLGLFEQEYLAFSREIAAKMRGHP